MEISEIDIEKIYFPKSKEYFNEVLSSFNVSNYRSAVVMLYSVALCDLLFKLQELRDMYGDRKADEIINSLSTGSSEFNYSEDPKWEKILVEKLRKETKILDNQTYMNLCHLRDDRHLSAHPALNANYELIKPNKETTAAHIVNIYSDILVKSPLFIKDVIDFLTVDLASKSDLYGAHNIGDLQDYLINRYFKNMPDHLLQGTIKAFWKMCFKLKDDPECIKNIIINRRALQTMYHYKTDFFLQTLEENSNFFTFINSDPHRTHLYSFLSYCPKSYDYFNKDVKLPIQIESATNPDRRLISWFMKPNKIEHIVELIEDDDFLRMPLGRIHINHFINVYEIEGLQEYLYTFLICHFGASPAFDDANKRYSSFIYPYLEKFSANQFILLIDKVDNNDQIHDRRSSFTTNTEIVIYAQKVLGNDFDFSRYPRFKFETVLPENSILEENN